MRIACAAEVPWILGRSGGGAEGTNPTEMMEGDKKKREQGVAEEPPACFILAPSSTPAGVFLVLGVLCPFSDPFLGGFWSHPGELG